MSDKFLGVSHNYVKQIKTPSELKMSKKGTMNALEKDIAGLISYTQLMVEGDGNAKKGSAPLGNRYFLKTNGQCTPIDKPNAKVTKYLYINNVPSGGIPILTGLTGTRSKVLRGLVPGVLENVGKLSPVGLFGAITGTSSSECRLCPKDICPVNVQKPIRSDYSTSTAFKKALNDYNRVNGTKQQYISMDNYNEAYSIAKESFSNIVNNKIGITQHMIIISLLIILGYSIIKKKL